MYLIKRTYENFYAYAYEPTDNIVIANKVPHFHGSNYRPGYPCTVVNGRPRHMVRDKVQSYLYTIQGNEPEDYPLTVAAFEIAPETPLTPDEYRVLVTEWEKHQMIKLLKQGV